MAAETQADGPDARGVDRLDTELVLRGFRRVPHDKGIAWSRERAPRMTVRVRTTRNGSRVTLQSPDLGSLRLDRQRIDDPAGLLRTIDAWQRAARDGGELPLTPAEPPLAAAPETTTGPPPPLTVPTPAATDAADTVAAPTVPPVPADHTQGASDVALVPLDAWDKVLGQLGNLYEAGRDAASARERAAKAETQAEFLKERLAELRQGSDEAVADLERRLDTARAAERAALERAAAAESDLFALRRETDSPHRVRVDDEDRQRSYWWRRRPRNDRR